MNVIFRAVVEQFGVAVACDFVRLVTSGPCEANYRGALAEIEAGLQDAKGDLAIVVAADGDHGAQGSGSWRRMRSMAMRMRWARS